MINGLDYAYFHAPQWADGFRRPLNHGAGYAPSTVYGFFMSAISLWWV